MSGLSYLNEYGSDSEDSEPEQRREKFPLPAPKLDFVTAKSEDNHLDDPQQHHGRVRSFPHVRGNWATFVYVKYPEQEISKTILELKSKLESNYIVLENCENIHISVSKTVVLKYHMINSFTSSIQQAVQNLESFELGFDSVKVYCNEDKTRTFIALKVDHFSFKYMHQLMKKVDGVLNDYRLPQFYEDPSFHASVLWINGDKKEELITKIEELTNLNQLQIKCKDILVDKISCKVGNKLYQYTLE